MLSWLLKKASSSQDTSPPENNVFIPEGFTAPRDVDELLALPRRQKLFTHIWQRTSISRQQFELLYLQPIQRYAALVQFFPASESHHHAYPGGMLDHGLEIMAYALKLRQSHLLPIGSTPEEQAAQSEAWSAGIAYAALLHDIGKIAVDLHVEYENGHVWHPWHGPLAKPYRFKYCKDREYRLHSASTGLLYHQILDVSILDWLSQTPELWAQLLYVLAGQFEHAGIIGEIVTKADQASVAQELGGNPEKVMSAPKNALQRKLLDGLRYLVKQELKLNNSGPADGWLTDEAVWLVSKTVADKLRAYLLSQGISGIPSKNSAVFDIMQEHGILLATVEDKAIWSATVQSSETNWSNTFTFMKISPALIWDKEDRPTAFTGTVTVNTNSDVCTTGEQENTAIESLETVQEQQVQDVPSVISSTKNQQADSLDAVFALLDMGDMPPTMPMVQQEDLPKDEPKNDITNSSNTTEMAAIEIQPIVENFPSNKKAVPTSKRTKKSKTIKESDESSHLSETIMSTQKDFTQSTMTEDKIEEKSPPIVKTIVGEAFMVWLKDAIVNRKLIINEPQALIHTVEDTLYLVTPGIFMRYSREHPELQPLAKAEKLTSWRYVQRSFEKMSIHKKQPGGLNIWTCSVQGPRSTKKVHGYLLAQPQSILPDILFNNPYLTIMQS